MVFNRLVSNKLGITDPTIRLLKIQKQTDEIALFTIFSAHATILNADKNFLPADYPGELVKKLALAVNFNSFMARTVGSKEPSGEELHDNFQQTKNISEALSRHNSENFEQDLILYHKEVRTQA